MVAIVLRAAGLFSTAVAVTRLSAIEPSSTEQVRGLRVKLSKVTQAAGIPQDLMAEAQHVEDDADNALHIAEMFHGNGADGIMQPVLDEYKAFGADLSKFQALSKSNPKAAAAELAPTTTAGPDGDEQAKDLEPELTVKVKTVLAHLKDADGLSPDEEATRAAAVSQLQAALATNSSDVVIRVMALNDGLMAAHEFQSERTDVLSKQQAELAAEIQEGEAKILYMMLKQRRQLPMKAQVAILKRHQFVNSTFAQQLLKSHAAKTPLYSQLESLLPGGMLEKIAPKAKAAGHLAAAGSDGRVLIVSSRMKNMVHLMISELTGVREKLQGVMTSSKSSASDQNQAKTIIAGLDAALKNVTKTNDLKTQLDILDDVEKSVGLWSADAASAAAAEKTS